MDPIQTQSFVESNVDTGLIPALIEFIKVPSLSTEFDSEWETNGHLEKAMNIMIDYINSLEIQNYKYEVLKEPGRPWLYFGSIEATNPSLDTILMYGHFDKQPHLSGWSEGLGATSPVIRDGRLYGRGSSDDGYAIPSSALIIKALQTFNIPHGKIVIIGENEEESDSASLVYYIKLLRPKIGDVGVVVCLDSGIHSYDRLWLTTSLRGCINFDLTIKTLKIGVHSGAGSGVIPSNFRILQQLISRVEDQNTGRILLKELHTSIEPRHYEEKAKTMGVLGDDLIKLLPFEEGVKAITNDLTQIAINNTLTPTLVVTGIEGLPQLQNAGNVLHPYLKARLSFRIPPGVDANVCSKAIEKELTRDPPYGAHVILKYSSPDNGWEQKPLKPWLFDALENASTKYFQKGFLTLGEGGTIPFMSFLGEEFPSAQFMITGVLGADSNAHSIDENLDIPYLKKLICCMIDIFSTIGTN
jgi:acetylornithine deacetylase/succinyl-diaminopimelate desuccinylase-like protein